MTPSTNRFTRPALEALEDRTTPSHLAAEFPGHGVWLYNSASGGSWQQLTTNNATQMAADSGGEVVAEFSGQGVWLYRNGGWQKLTANNASALGIAANYLSYVPGLGTVQSTNVVAEFPSQGLWRYSITVASEYPTATGGGWTQLTANNASLVAVHPDGYVAADFPGSGVWYYYDGPYGASGWQQLTGADAVSLALNGSDPGYASFKSSYVVASFAGYGVWYWSAEGAGWRVQQLTASEASAVSVNDFGDVVGEFPGWGVWSYVNSTVAASSGWAKGWNHLTWADASQVGIDASGNAYGAFPGWGVWYDQSYSWQCLSPSNASSVGAAG
jgi:hypothetical protein